MIIRDRIRELRRVPASSLRPNPRNWRTHPGAQADALKAVLAEVGLAAAALARELPDGSLELIDGHLRAETLGDGDIPVLVLDVTEAEAAKILATFDPLGALAGADAGRLDALLKDVAGSGTAVDAMLADLAAAHGVAGAGARAVEIKPLATRPPPKMTWALVGIPTVRFGEIAGRVEALAAVAGVVCEVVANDGD